MPFAQKDAVRFLFSAIAAIIARAHGEGAWWRWAIGVVCGACALVLPPALAALALLLLIVIIMAVLTGN